MKHTYQTSGVCAREIQFELENGVIHNVNFIGGCNGNLKAIARLVEGKNAEEIASILKGNTCGPRNTSCADQFSKALTKALNE